jgi:hypothetical protein
MLRATPGLGPIIVLAGLLTVGCTVDLRVVPPGGDDSDSSSTGDSGSPAPSTGGVTRLRSAVSEVQTADPRDVELPDVLVQQGDTVILNQQVNIIIDIEQELVIEELPDVTVLGFENQTGWDIYVRYLADGDLQGVYVLDGEALLLEYPCLDTVELLSEDDIDPLTGVLLDSFNLASVYVNPDDFSCGDALVITLDPFTVDIAVELIDLGP